MSSTVATTTSTMPRKDTVSTAFEKLDPARHAQLRRRTVEDYRFAAGIAAVPVGASEMVEACRSLPVVFLGAEDPTPHAIVGLAPGENALVGADGAWKAGVYVPAGLRHYPFALIDDEKTGIAVGVDAGSDLWGPEGQPLFGPDGTQTDFVGQTVRFMTALQAEYEIARSVFRPVLASGLLVQRRVRLKTKGSDQERGIIYWAVDPERLAAQSDSSLAGWVRNNTMALIHAHLGSQGNFARLVS